MEVPVVEALGKEESAKDSRRNGRRTKRKLTGKPIIVVMYLIRWSSIEF